MSAHTGFDRFTSEHPLTNPADDALQRVAHARALAAHLLLWSDPSASLVVGIMGRWGDGKTTFWNFVEHEFIPLQTLGIPQVRTPEIERFNAWEYSGSEHMAAALLERIGTAAERRFKYQGLDLPFRRRIRQYAKILEAGTGWITDTIQKLKLEDGWWARIYELFCSFIARLQSRDSLRIELSGMLCRLTQGVIVVIDDIDRLSDEEIAALFRVVKANADFPNIVYVLLFHPEQVANALDRLSEGRGEEFVEKIVQVPIPLPQVDQRDFRRMLADGIDRLLRSIPQAQELREEYRIDQLCDYLIRLFPTLRTTNRYLNALRFYARAAMHEGALQLNPVDLAALEAIRLIEPSFHTWIAKSRRIALGWTESEGKLQAHEVAERKKKLRNELDDRIERLEEATRENLRVLFYFVFPVAPGGPDDPDNREIDWTPLQHDISVMGQYRRANSLRFFDSYFQYRPARSALGAEDIAQLLRAASDRVELENELRKQLSLGRFEPLLDALRGHKKALEKKEESVIDAIFAIGDVLGEIPDDSSATPRDFYNEVVGPFFWEPGKSNRADHFIESLKKSPALFFVWWAAFLEIFHYRQILTKGQIPELKTVVAEKFRALKDRISIHTKFVATALAVWGECDAAGAREWAKAQLETATGWLLLVRSTSTGMNALGYPMLEPANLLSVVDLSDLKNARLRLFPSNPDGETALLEAFDYFYPKWEESLKSRPKEKRRAVGKGENTGG